MDARYWETWAVRGPVHTQGLEETISADCLIILHDSWLDFILPGTKRH